MAKPACIHEPKLPCVDSSGWWGWPSGVRNAPVRALNYQLRIITADHVHPFMAMIYSSHNEQHAPCYKAQVISNQFHEFHEFPQSTEPNDHLWDVNLQQFYDSHINIDQNFKGM